MDKSIIGIHLETGKLVTFDSVKEASEKLELDRSHVSKCCQGKRKQHKGYTWSYTPYVDISPKNIKTWSIQEEDYLKKFFQNESFEKIVKDLTTKDFRDIVTKAKELSLTRSNVCSTKRSAYDLLYELTEQTFFKNSLKKYEQN